MTELFLGVIVVILLAGIFILYKKVNDLSSKNEANDKIVKLLSDTLSNKISDMDSKMEERLNVVKENVATRLNENIRFMQGSTTEVNNRLTNASKVIGDLQTKLAAFEEGSKRIFDLGKDITDLQNILKAPKLRGGFGEMLLEKLLTDILHSEFYELQYHYKTGSIVDAIIRLRDGYFLPIDAKFPLENFSKLTNETDERNKELLRRELLKNMKKHVDDICSKYISTEEGSLDIALMYIPAENIYYEVVVRDDENLNIRDYCFGKRVIPVSPNTLYSYIQIILMGMRGMQVSQKAKEILHTIKNMEKEFSKVVDDYAVLGKHLQSAQNKYLDGDKHLQKFSTKLQGALAMSDSNVEVLESGPATPVAPDDGRLPL
jgi:DNA recombination protein RmuC